MAKVRNEDVQRPVLRDTFTPILPAVMILFGSVGSLCHLLLPVVSKRDITVDVLSSFPFGLEFLQGQFP